MNLKDKTFRDGTSQKDRNIAALDSNYVSIEERSVEDLLKFVLKFAEQLKFYNNSNQLEGNWKLFFGGDPIPDHAHDKEGLTDDEKQYLIEMAAYLQNPDKYADYPQKLTLDSAPHRVLLLVYIKLLDYARQQFTDLTRRHLAHYYRDVLQLTEKPATPDQVNVVFELAEGETEYLLEQNTRLDGGEDSSGNPRLYALDDDIVVNRAALARVNTLHVQRRIIDLKSIHDSDTQQDSVVKSNIDFLSMLKWGLGYPDQGDDLPLYPNNTVGDTTVAMGELQTIYNNIKDLDYDAATTSYNNDYIYVLAQLNFVRLEDFTYVMRLNERQQDKNPVSHPSDEEWQQAYDYVESAFLKRKVKTRQGRLKEINEKAQNGGFIAMNEYVFGAGETNQLPQFTHAPKVHSSVTLHRVNLLLRASEPGQAAYNDARAYVNKQLYMSVDDFRYMMDAHQDVANLADPAWRHVYEILERAQSAKENYAPSLKSIQVQRLVPRAVFARDKIDFPVSFSTFGETSQGLANPGLDTKSHHLGFAVSSPLLLLKEGKRVIRLSFTFNNRLDREMLKTITDGLTVEFTGGVDLPWFSAEHKGISIINSSTEDSQILNLDITLEETAPALLAPVVETTTFTPVQPVTSPYPVIRLSVKDIIEDGSTQNNLYYTKLKDLQLQQLSLDVSVGEGIGTGIKNLAVRNDNNVLNSNSTMAPFGQSPHHLAGFYIANEEISQKLLKNITFYLEWINLPESFSSQSGHYKGYKDINGAIIGVTDGDFEVELKVFNNRAFGSIQKRDLFYQDTSNDAKLSSISNLFYDSADLSDSYPDIELVNTEANDPFDWGRYFKLELAGSNSTFLQDAYVVALQNLGAEHGLEDNTGNEVASFTDRVVRNVMGGTTPPQFQSATVSGSTLTIKFDENLAPANLADSAFTVEKIHLDSASTVVPLSGAPAISGTTVVLTLVTPLLDGDTGVRVSYNKPGFGVGNKLAGTAGNEVASFTDRVVRNVMGGTTPPQFQSATVNGSTLMITFNKSLDADSLPGMDAFTAKVTPNGGSAMERDLATTDPVVISGITVTLMLSSAVVQDDMVTVSYTRPASGAGKKINQPYVPQIRQVSVDYSCTSMINFTSADQSTASLQVLQIHPFGQVDLLKTKLLTDTHGDPTGYHLLPQFSENGHLFIGLEKLQDKQEISLLFQMDEGSENSDLEPAEMSWNYLSSNNWIKFDDEELLSDSTKGMLDTGIIRFHPPSSLDATESHPPATTSNHLMPNGFHWFQAQVPDNIHAFPKGVAIIPQAASATHLLQTPASEHLNESLPANSIKKLVSPISAIDTVKQPYSSFGGKGQEDYTQFIRRVSERLRHKDRAVTMWDYERLVLEQFPDIYKVKCLNQTAQENDPAAAKVKLVVIPNLINRTPFFPFQPKVSQKLRSQIVDYLKDRVSPFVDFQVVNPRYEEIRYRVTLKFRQKESEGFYLRQLNQDIINYLSPWAYSNQADVTFGGAVHRSSLIHFITNLSYVDFIGNVELVDHVLISQDSEGFVGKQQLNPLNQDVVETRFPDSILVSSPNHFIDLVTDEYEALQFNGIGYMAVDVDFIVT